LTDCPAAEEGAAAALLPPVVGDPIAVWLILKSKRHLLKAECLDWF
jgi:hypothetical protein